MSINSRNKGAAGEREWAGQCRDAGFPAHRGQQHKGTPDSPDVICPDLDPHFHSEVKRVQRLNITEAYAKAKADAGPEQRPYVAHRKNHHEWLVTISAETFFELVREFV